MLRRVLLASALTLLAVSPVPADTIGYQASPSPYGVHYSPSASPFEAFEWTPLEFAAFQAYGGDFANIRKPVTPIYFLELPFTPDLPPGPDDELVIRGFEPPPHLENLPYFEPMPQASTLYVSDLPLVADESASTIPEPGLLALIGIGMLGVSNRLRRHYRAQR